jgi:hypothetical protein
MKPELKIAIVGPSAAQRSVDLYDQTWTFWGINSCYRRLAARWAAMFNLHRLAHLERDVPQYIGWDAAFSRLNPKVKMVVVDTWRGLLKNQVIFPRAELEHQPRSDYHASSFDWMLAYAVHLGAKIVSVHGANFALDSNRDEPISARACLEYWAGYAEGRGTRVWTAGDCDLFLQYHLVASRTVYGYDDVVMVEDRRARRRVRK